MVAVSGLSMIRGNCYTAGGYARAYADIGVLIDEFETLKPVDSPVHSGLGGTSGAGPAELAPDPMRPIGTLVFKRRVASNPTILINHETAVIGYQIVGLDQHPDFTVLVMPIRPGNVYRWWIGSYQYCQCALAGWAGSNIAFDFGPVFFAFA
jgi:hypothetical protein